MPEQSAPASHQNARADDSVPLSLTLALLQATHAEAIDACLPHLAAWLGAGADLRIVTGEDGDDVSAGEAVAAIPLPGAASSARVLGMADDLARIPPTRLAQLAALLDAVSRGIAADAAARETVLQATHAEAERLKLDVVALLSHEMRTPLASIKGYATALLLDGVAWDEADRTTFLHAIDDEADHLTWLVTDVLEAANLEAGGIRVQREPVLLPRLVRRTVDAMRVMTDRHRFMLSMPERFPVVETDPQRVEQVLKNLLDNAVKYAPGGGLIVVRGEVFGDEVVLSVVDEGLGIAPAHLNRLFERFFRARGDGAGGVAGAGLGLPISQSIVHALGGRIWAESMLGSGTTLSFTLPLTAPDVLGGPDADGSGAAS